MESLEKCTGFVAGVVVAKVGLRQGRDSSAADVKPHGDLVADSAGEMEIRIPMGQQDGSSSAPAPATDATTSGIQSQRIRRTCRRFVVDMVLRLHGSLLRKICSALSDFKLHIITGTCAMLQWNRLQWNRLPSKDKAEHLKRLIEFIKKAIPFESVLMAALCNHPYYYSSNTTFKICLVLVLLALFTDFLSGLLLHLKSLGFLIKYLVYTSSVTQMLMPFFLFVSSGQLQFYMILVVPLPFFSVSLFQQTGSGDGAATDAASALDHSFDISSWIYAFSSGGALIGPNTISIKFIATTTLACSLFLTIFIARYLMLVSTLRPQVVVVHVETLMNILKLLWGLTIILFILDRFGWRFTIVATTVTIVDAVLFSMPSWLLSYSSKTTNGSGDEVDDQRNNLQLLWAVIVSILFIALTRTYSEHVAAHESAPLGPAETRRLLIYFGAFLWSLNRMLITPGDVAVPQDQGEIAVPLPHQEDVAAAVLPDQGDIAVAVPLDQGDVAVPPDQGDVAVAMPPDREDVAVPPDQGGHQGTMFKVWYVLECVRGSVVLFAALEMVTYFFTTFIMG
ncbi:unnamed protein product [Urochloa humidicola]